MSYIASVILVIVFVCLFLGLTAVVAVSLGKETHPGKKTREKLTQPQQSPSLDLDFWYEQLQNAETPLQRETAAQIMIAYGYDPSVDRAFTTLVRGASGESVGTDSATETLASEINRERDPEERERLLKRYELAARREDEWNLRQDQLRIALDGSFFGAHSRSRYRQW